MNTESGINSCPNAAELIITVMSGIRRFKENRLDATAIEADLKKINDIDQGITTLDAIEQIKNESIRRKAIELFIKLGQRVDVHTKPLPNSKAMRHSNGWLISHIDWNAKTVDLARGVLTGSSDMKLLVPNKKLERNDGVPFSAISICQNKEEI